MKKHILLLTIFLLSISFRCVAQITFQKTYGGNNYDAGEWIQQTIDGGYIISGVTYSFGTGSSNAYLIKVTMIGDTLWTKTYRLTNYNNAAFVQQTTDSGYIIVGTAAFTNNGFANDICLIKTDGNGKILWSKIIGGSDNDVGYSVKQTFDGGYIVTGFTGSFPLAQENIYLIKTDINGSITWTKSIGGSTGTQVANSIGATIDSGYVVAGYTSCAGANGMDVYIIKMDSNGDTVWTKGFGGFATEVANCIQQTLDSGYIICGNANSFGTGAYDVYLIKINSKGDTLWTKTYGGTGQDIGYSIQQTTDTGYIVCGITSSFGAGNYDVYLIKTDSKGDTLWTKAYGGTGEDMGLSVLQTQDGGYIVAGYTESFGAGSKDVYIIKTDANGYTGCNETSTATIVGNPATIVTKPSIIVGSGGSISASSAQVNAGGIVTTICSSVRINEITGNNSIIVYPNPTVDKLIIELNNSYQKLNTQIYNVLGEKVFEREYEVAVSSFQIDVSEYKQGIYLLKLSDGEQPFTKKIIIE